MLELKPKHKDKIQIVDQKQQESQHILLGTIKPSRGHTLFEFNKTTKKICRAQFVSEDISFHEDPKLRAKKKKVVVKENCFYISALNEKNAVKKLKKIKLL